MDGMENKVSDEKEVTNNSNNNATNNQTNAVTSDNLGNTNQNDTNSSDSNVVKINNEKSEDQRIDMVDQNHRDILSLINPQQKTEEFHLINKKNLPKKKDRYAGYVYKPPSKFKRFLLVVFMIFIILLVIFLPEVDTYVKKYLGMTNEPGSNEITTGRLICKTTNNGNVFTYDYNYVFNYTDKKLDLLTYTNTAKGSATEDSELLDARYAECQELSRHADGIEGVTVTCELNPSSVVEKQVIDYNKYNRDEMITAFVEAGGNYPDFELGADIDKISKRMTASNYSCEKAK